MVTRTESSPGPSHVVWFSLTLALVLVNFGFDVFRRFDFEAERNELRAGVEDTHELLEQSRMLLSSSQGAFDELELFGEQVAEHLSATAAQLHALQESVRHVASSNGGGEDASAADAPDVDRAQGADLDDLVTIVDVMSAPYERLREERAVLPNHPLFDRYSSLPPKARDWDPEAILDNLERDTGRVLTPLERDIVRLRIESYQRAAQTFSAAYRSGLYGTVPQRVAAGDYDAPDERGNYPDRSGEEPREALASGFIGGRNHFVWSTEDYPDLHRLQLVGTYMPFAMLKSIYGEFSKEASR